MMTALANNGNAIFYGTRTLITQIALKLQRINVMGADLSL